MLPPLKINLFPGHISLLTKYDGKRILPGGARKDTNFVISPDQLRTKRFFRKMKIYCDETNLL
jgi:hypothetical protein